MDNHNTSGAPSNADDVEIQKVASAAALLGASLYWMTKKPQPSIDSNQTKNKKQNNDSQEESKHHINLNFLLSRIGTRHMLSTKENWPYYRVFRDIFNHLYATMKDIDPYFKTHCRPVNFVKERCENLIKEEYNMYDMDVFIDLPSSIKILHGAIKTDIMITNKSPGFVQIKVDYKSTEDERNYGVRLRKTDKNGWEQYSVNRTVYLWKDITNYLLQSKFVEWFNNVISRALQRFKSTFDGIRVYDVEGERYLIDFERSQTKLTIKNHTKQFELEVYLVPALMISEERWIEGKGYRSIPDICRKGHWSVLPDPDAFLSPYERTKTWKVDMRCQEKQLISDNIMLNQAIDLVKIFRNVQRMDRISNYSIKTLLFWESEGSCRKFWRQADNINLFTTLLQKLHDALEKGIIRYFWNDRKNLIAHIFRTELNNYCRIIKGLLNALENKNPEKITEYLTTPNEYAEIEKDMFRRTSVDAGKQDSTDLSWIKEKCGQELSSSRLSSGSNNNPGSSGSSELASTSSMPLNFSLTPSSSNEACQTNQSFSSLSHNFSSLSVSPESRILEKQVVQRDDDARAFGSHSVSTKYIFSDYELD